MQTEFFQSLARLHAYLWDIQRLKNNSAVSRSGRFYRVNQKFSLTNTFVVFSKLKVLLWNNNKKINNNPLLSKSTLKYLGYCQIFWVEVQRLQDQYISIITGSCFITGYPWRAKRNNCNTNDTIQTKFFQICFLTKYEFFYMKK